MPGREYDTVGEAPAVDFRTLLAEWAEAIVANDPARIAEFMEPDWTLVTPESGQISGDRFLAVVTSGELTHSRMSFEVVGLRRLGDVTVVVAHGTNAGSWQGQPFEADEWVTDVFVRREGRWRCVVSALTPNHSSPLHAR